MGGPIIVFVVLCIYFLPTIVGYNKKRPNSGAIFVLNLFLGWTLIGWVVALVWATTSGGEKQAVMSQVSGAQELEKLAELKSKGVLSEDEFQSRKKKILES